MVFLLIYSPYYLVVCENEFALADVHSKHVTSFCHALTWAGIVGCVSCNRPLKNPIMRPAYAEVQKHAS